MHADENNYQVVVVASIRRRDFHGMEKGNR
jgi:hypothetical protein